VAHLVVVLRYMTEGRGFDFVFLILRSTQPVTEMSTRLYSLVKGGRCLRL